MSACSDDGGGGGGSSLSNRPDGGGSILGGNNNTSKTLDAEDYCTRVCKVADDCDDDFDKQTCAHRCDNQTSSISKLNPKVQSDLFECFDDSACKVVNADDFIASCLGDAVDELSVTKAGKDFCAELEEAADACDFEDYDEDICLQSTTAFADDVLADAKVCAGKKCALVVECLEATFTLPGELDGTPVGLDSKGKVASGNDAVSAVAALLPKTTGSSPVSPVNPNVSPDEETDASVGPVGPDPSDDVDDTNEDTSDETEDTSDEPTSEPGPTDTTEPAPTDTTEPAPTDTSEPAPTDTSSSEPAPTDTTSSSEPAPTSDATDTSDEPTDETDTTDTTDVPTDATDTTDTPELGDCESCRYENCYTEVVNCALDEGEGNSDSYTCAELDAAVSDCNDLYGSGPEWDACFSEASSNTPDASYNLFADYINCYVAAQEGPCANSCQ